MTIHLTCVNPQCAKELRARDDQAGKLTDCPFCGTRMRIPRLDGPFVESAEPELAAGPAGKVEEGEVLDWIGPADPAALKAAAPPPPPEPQDRPVRPKHKPTVPPPAPLTHERLHEEGVAALNGSPPPPMPQAAAPPGEPAAEADAGFSRVAVRQVPLPAPAPSAAAAAVPEPSEEVDWGEPPEEAVTVGRRLLKAGSWLLLGLIVLAPFLYVLAQVAGGGASGVGPGAGLLIVFGISVFALLGFSVAVLLVMQHRLVRLERQIASLRNGHESAHRILHEAVRDTHRRIGLPCPRCHDRIDLTGRGTEFDCPGCGLPIAIESGRLVDRRRRDEEPAGG